MGVTVVRGYVPKDLWYDYHTGKAVEVQGRFVDMDAPLTKINLHVRAGHILPWQKPESNTQYSRLNPLGLIVALNDEGVANGSLFWDDGEGIVQCCTGCATEQVNYIRKSKHMELNVKMCTVYYDTVQNGLYLLTTFSVFDRTLTSEVSVNGLAEADRLTLGVVRVWGVTEEVSQVTMKVAGKPDANLIHSYDPEIKELQINATSQSHTIEKSFTITWTTI
ncbi:hypothetical protein cypCar_00047229 [Cyprinus carpio]|nr:hypothetical protein cypCar_00047229 [Cyprinus carpio]